ncbi:hypothetical protein LEP1GSC060_1339 [Leptospira weilii serovar Ranarum str. ICFT]|uniref:Uncharacterized protein n=1 Tax=Leptospira weilii serovar Ranarum str. ICFT TaxID=1218598 RepID=N1WM30_9LEPT|nr:hypothetical protein LEP1GSC060_1339 [Leptospira weilii serovar Ranarum str. ICFT]
MVVYHSKYPIDCLRKMGNPNKTASIFLKRRKILRRRRFECFFQKLSDRRSHTIVQARSSSWNPRAGLDSPRFSYTEPTLNKTDSTLFGFLHFGRPFFPVLLISRRSGFLWVVLNQRISFRSVRFARTFGCIGGNPALFVFFTHYQNIKT